MNQVDLCEAIASKIAALWPDRMIYRDFCPADFQRPSSFLYVTEAGFTAAGIAVVLWNVETELELFCATDDYDAQSTEALRQNQAAVLEAFRHSAFAGRVSITERGAGLHFLLRLDTALSDETLLARAKELGVHLRFLSSCTALPEHRTPHVLVVSYAALDADRLPQAVSLLNEILRP